MRHLFLLFALAAFNAGAQDMRPNKEPVPSPSDLRAATGEDRPQGDLATEAPRTDGDRPTSALQDPRNAAAGGTRPAPSPSDLAAPRR